MAYEIQNKVALITGGASGIGFCYAKELLKHGAKGVTLADINQKLGQKAVDDLGREFGTSRAIFVKTDVTNLQSFEDAFKKTVEQFNNVDILINSAGILDDRIWQKELEINIKGTIHGILLGLENYLQNYRSGSESIIINTSSVAGVAPYKENPIYTGTKFAVFGMSKAWGDEIHYQRTKVKVIVICPGVTNTPLTDQIHKKILKPEYAKDFVKTAKTLPIQKPENVAKGMIEVIQKAESGSGWIIEGGQSPYEYQLTPRAQFAPKL